MKFQPDYHRQIIGFWANMTYDAFDFEAPICDILPGHGAIFWEMLGPIQTRDDFNEYPFNEIPEIFWKTYTPHLEAIRKVTPPGMKAYRGCGYGIFEIMDDLIALGIDAKHSNEDEIAPFEVWIEKYNDRK